MGIALRSSPNSPRDVKLVERLVISTEPCELELGFL